MNYHYKFILVYNNLFWFRIDFFRIEFEDKVSRTKIFYDAVQSGCLFGVATSRI